MCEGYCNCQKPCEGCTLDELPFEKITRLNQVSKACTSMIEKLLSETAANENEAKILRFYIIKELLVKNETKIKG